MYSHRTMDRSDIPRLVCRLRCRWSTAQRPPGGILGGAACWERPSTEFFTQRRPLQQFGSGSRYSRRCRARQECWDASARNRSRLLLEATQAIRLASKRFREKLQSGIVHQERTNKLTPTCHWKRLVGQAQPYYESKGLSRLELNMEARFVEGPATYCPARFRWELCAPSSNQSVLDLRPKPP